MQSDARLQQAQALPIDDVADRLGIPDLKRAGRELVGPCPVCGGRDRFSISPPRNVFNCRNCGGGDVIGLVRLVLDCDFRAALSWLVGDANVAIDPAEAARRAKAAEQARIAREAAAQAARERAITGAQAIWAEGQPAARTPVSDYLSLRGMPAWLHDAPPAALRYHPALRYTVPSASGRGYDVIHTGPAMLAAVVAPCGTVTAVHRTWIDLSQPKGKAKIIGPDGEVMQAKKVLGSKKGAAIRLVGAQAFNTLVMGEGIETTLSAYSAAANLTGRAFWAGIDLGNMAGRRVLTGHGMKYRGIPDLDDRDAFVPPPWIKRLIFIQDGDSAPRETRAKLLAGLRRAKHFNPALRIQIAHAGDGVDLNDVLIGKGNQGDQQG